MVVVGVTGHSNITDATSDLVRDEIVKLLRAESGEVVGLTCLARGADQVFADAVLEVGGSLSVVIPAADYFGNIPDPVAKQRCDRYLADATEKVQLDNAISGPRAYLARIWTQVVTSSTAATF